MLMQGPYNTNLLIAGWDEKTGPSLYWMDYLATMHSMNVAGTGYGACTWSSPLTPPAVP
jgi:20S proteasome subunit beta 4